LKFYVVALLIAVPLQMLQLLPTANGFGTSRATGNTNGPYELAAISSFFLCYLGYRNKERLYGAASVVLVVLTSARSTFVGVAIGLVKVMARGSKRKVVLITAGSVVGIALLVGFGTFLNSGKEADQRGNVIERLSTATDLLDVDFKTIYEEIPTYRTSDEYFDGTFLLSVSLSHDAGGDASTMQRVFRWSALIKSALANVDSTLIGLGPSFGTDAVDGYYVRLFAETGLVGTCLFALFIYNLMFSKTTSPWQFREYVFILLMTAVSIDIFVSYKPMLLLWLWHGMNQYEAEKGTNANRLPNAC